MAALVLPESVRVAKVDLAPTGINTNNYVTIPIKPGEDEVALLLASNWSQYVTAACLTEAAIWRKAHPNEDANLLGAHYQSEDIIDRCLIFVTQATAVGLWRNSHSEYRVYPYPVVLIRPPQLVGYSSVSAAGRTRLTCWYVIQKVTDKQLAKLLVKDHE